MFQMPVRSMTLTTGIVLLFYPAKFQMPVRSMTLTTMVHLELVIPNVLRADACQINDFDHQTP